MTALQRYIGIWITLAMLTLAVGCQNSTPPDSQYNYTPADDPDD